jgi:hypothetical protein
VEALHAEYYVSTQAARAALRSGDSFNAIHLRTAVKVDVFPVGRDSFDLERLRRRQRIQLSTDPPVHVFVDTPEHSILRKLEWFRRGGEVSERQWQDVQGILRVQGERLDESQLRMWAAHLGVPDLLKRALDQAGKSA